MTVPARISIVTLGVTDLDRSKRFYEALGWTRASSGGDEICWFRTANSYLGLFPYDKLAKDANVALSSRGAGFNGVTLAICVDSEQACTSVIESAATAGAEVLKPAKRTEWGGFSGYFADPDGFAWEVAFNPSFSVGDDGRITIP